MRAAPFISLIVLQVLLVACSSMPVRNLPQVKSASGNESLGSVAIVGCESYRPKTNYEVGCDDRSAELARVLRSTGLFGNVVIGESENSDYLITLMPYARYPYQFSIGHNPGILLLSSVVPFWERYEYGYDFKISPRHAGEEKRVNSIESGTHLMWSVSILINVLPSRGIPGTFHENEVKHLRHSIIGALR